MTVALLGLVLVLSAYTVIALVPSSSISSPTISIHRSKTVSTSRVISVSSVSRGRVSRSSILYSGRKNDVEDLDEATQKYGFEVGMFKAVTSKDKDSGANTAKALLAKYGAAYLATSITLAVISFSICYALVSQGVDVASILEKVGINVDSNGESAGTIAIAYAIHKAASPIRFPPTVALTPVVANLLGKGQESSESESESE